MFSLAFRVLPPSEVLRVGSDFFHDDYDTNLPVWVHKIVFVTGGQNSSLSNAMMIRNLSEQTRTLKVDGSGSTPQDHYTLLEERVRSCLEHSKIEGHILTPLHQKV